MYVNEITHSHLDLFTGSMYPHVLVATSVVTVLVLLSHHYTAADDVIIQKRVSTIRVSS